MSGGQHPPVVFSPPFQPCAALCLPLWPSSMALRGTRGALRLLLWKAAGETVHMLVIVLRSRSA